MSPITKQLRVRSRVGRWLGVGAAAATVVAVGGFAAAPSASAADPGSAPGWTLAHAASAGNFLDVSVGGQPPDAVVRLAHAQADYDGDTASRSDQNPLDAAMLDAIDLPLTGRLQFPGLLGIKLGTVNQVAAIDTDGTLAADPTGRLGHSWGGSGAVRNSGAVSVGGNNSAYPAGATIELDPSAIPGAPASLDAIGALTIGIDGLSAVADSSGFSASALAGANKPASTDSAEYAIADITVSLSSPLLGQLFAPVTSGLNGLLTTLTGQIGNAAGTNPVPASCADLATNGFPIADGTVTVDPTHAALKISVDQLLRSLHLDLNHLPPNTDLIGYLTDYLTDPSGLAGGLSTTVTHLIGECTSSVTAEFGSAPVLGDLLDTLTQGQHTITGTLDDVAAQLANSSGVGGQLSDALGSLLAMGVNVQPNGPAGSYRTAFGDPLLPKQGVDHRPYDTLVRALEIDVLGDALNVGLANAAVDTSVAGPAACPSGTTLQGGVCVPTCPSGQHWDAGSGSCLCDGSNAVAQDGVCASVAPQTPVHQPNAAMPTGVNAGLASTTGGPPTAALILLVVGLLLAGGGAAAWRLRGMRGPRR